MEMYSGHFMPIFSKQSYIFVALAGDIAGSRLGNACSIVVRMARPIDTGELSNAMTNASILWAGGRKSSLNMHSSGLMIPNTIAQAS